MIFLLFFMILDQSVYLSAVQFIFTPSPNIGIYQLAHYQCSVDHTDVSITWFVNGSKNDTNKLGIIVSGGPQQSNLTIYGYPHYNTTIVKCHALGFVNNKVYSNFDNATLRIQGKLAVVNNLICHVQSQYINCSWSPPFSLISIPGYIINVTYGQELVTQNIISSTTWQYNYCPSQFGTYTISVAGNNSAGEGEISTTSVEVPEDNITKCDVIPKRLSNFTILAEYSIQTVYFLTPSSISIHLTNNASTSVFDGNVTFDGNKFIGNIDINMSRKKKWNVTIMLIYNCRTLVDNSKKFSTFDVQNGNLMVDNSTTGKVCFTCHFIERSRAIGCYVEYKCVRTDFNGNIVIKRTSVDASTASKCVTGIYTSNYNVTFYDMDYNNVPYTTEYAVKLTNQLVTGLSPLSIPTSISTIPISSSLSPTSCTDCTNTRITQGDSSVVTFIVVPVVIVLIFIIIVAVIIVGVILYRIKTKKCKQISSQDNVGNEESKMLTVAQLNQLKYTDVTPIHNGPLPAADLHSIVPYSTVVHETPIMDQYSLVHQSSYLVNGSSNEEYAKLNHNIHASTQLYNHTQHSHTSTSIPPNMTSYISSPDSQYSTLSNKTSDKLTIKKTTELTHKALVTYVAPHVTTKLREIGTALVLTPSELDDIEENHQGINGVFQLWYETKRRPYTWDTLLTILRSPAVNELELANKLTR